MLGNKIAAAEGTALGVESDPLGLLFQVVFLLYLLLSTEIVDEFVIQRNLNPLIHGLFSD